jgi:hypothetical protein
MLVVQSLVPDEELASNDWEKNPPAHLWTAEGFGEGYASVAIVGGMLFMPGISRTKDFQPASIC